MENLSEMPLKIGGHNVAIKIVKSGERLYLGDIKGIIWGPAEMELLE